MPSWNGWLRKRSGQSTSPLIPHGRTTRIESFHDKLRDECLNRELFGSLHEARIWRVEYNAVRPHNALGYRTPNQYAHELANQFDGGYVPPNPGRSPRQAFGGNSRPQGGEQTKTKTLWNPQNFSYEVSHPRVHARSRSSANSKRSLMYNAAIRRPRTPRLARWLLVLAIAYLASPMVLVPDFIPVLGHLDSCLGCIGHWTDPVRTRLPSAVKLVESDHDAKAGSTFLSQDRRARPGIRFSFSSTERPNGYCVRH